MCRIWVAIAVVLMPTVATAQLSDFRNFAGSETADKSSAPRELGQLTGQKYRKACCNRRNAIIGAAIGAGLGVLAVRNACDAGDCTSDYVKYMLLFGGIGAGVGAVISPSQPGGIPLPGRARLRVAPIPSIAGHGAFIGLIF